MTTEHDALVEAIAEAIYAARGYAGCSHDDTGETRSVWASSQDYAEAVMSVLAAHVRQRQAEAWDEGYTDCVAGDTCRCHSNPYVDDGADT